MKHRVKKLLGLILVFTMIIAPVIPAATVHAADWAAQADTSWYDGHESETEFLIGTAEQLSGMNELLKAGTTGFAGKTIRLTSDIDLSCNTWVSNGNPLVLKSFDGTLEGDGHVIKSSGSFFLFSELDGNIRNLGIVSEDNVGFWGGEAR